MKTKTFFKIAVINILLTGLTATISLGAGGGSSGGSNSSMFEAPSAAAIYDKGVKADRAGDYKTALQYFQQANEMDRNNPEILNMLAHSQRKLGMINEALANYNTALMIRPNFPDAREYLGEAYIQAALREIETLKSYGKAGEEQRNDLIKALKTAAANIR
jgi:tetratricopeptide (TPR) repeat protein